MQSIRIPYNKGFIKLEIGERNLKAVIEGASRDSFKNVNPVETVKESLQNPLQSMPLKDLAVNKNKVVIITSDHTRPMPSKITLPCLLNEIRSGNPQADITILIATALHRQTTKNEMIKMFGEDLVEKEKIVVHDADCKNDMVFLGKMPSGFDLWINKLALEAELLVCEGFIEPHFFAGFSGGRKSILPGVAYKDTINCIHSAMVIGHPKASTGQLSGNPIHGDMLFAARKAGVDFILNVALNDDKEIIAAFSGDLEAAHEKGCDFVLSRAKAARVVSDIVITSNGGYPLDQNLYQCAKSVTTAGTCLAENGVLILVASCCDGVGGEYFGELMLQSKTPAEMLERIYQTPAERTIPEQWCVQKMMQIMSKHTLILVTDFLDHELVRKMNIIPAYTIEEAMKIAHGIKGQEAAVTVIPDGVSVIID